MNSIFNQVERNLQAAAIEAAQRQQREETGVKAFLNAFGVQSGAELHRVLENARRQAERDETTNALRRELERRQAARFAEPLRFPNIKVGTLKPIEIKPTINIIFINSPNAQTEG